MTFASDIAGDMTYFDGTETLASYVHEAPTPSTQTTITGCLRRVLSRRDVQIMGSMALEGDWAAWHIPASGLSSDARNGDRFVDADGKTWLVESAEKQTLKKRWRLIAQRRQ